MERARAGRGGAGRGGGEAGQSEPGWGVVGRGRLCVFLVKDAGKTEVRREAG